ncbi:MAG: DNA polymerase I [Spirochaetes bacterium GWC1_61_12]|nr:MAG: DNA polymerase I [Spirochaetes bacterium GWC1_61_12]
MKPLYILDAYGLIYSSYYAFITRPLKNARGENVSAVFGFFRSLFTLWAHYQPECFACAFDSAGPTFRHQLFDQYKATRQKTPEDLHSQIPLIVEILDLLGVPQLRADGYEADDLIATLAGRCREEGRPCYIISRDKDLLQLVGGTTRALRPDKDQGFLDLGPDEVLAEWGVGPDRIHDYLSLAGDASDNIPGVPGVGDKTALKLLEAWGSFEAIWQNLDQVKPDSLQKKLAAGRDSAMLSHQLVRLVHTVPIEPATVDALSVGSLRRQAADAIFLRENMSSLVSPGGRAAATAANAEKAASPPAADLAGPTTASKPGPAKPAAAQPSGDRGDLFGGDYAPRKPAVAAAPGHAAAHDTVVVAPSGWPRVAPSTPRPTPDYQVVLSLAELDDWLLRAAAAGCFAFDCETDSLDEMRAQPVGFSLAVGPGQACYVPLQAPDATVLPAEAVRPRLAALLERPDCLIIGQNLKFDFHIMENYGINVRCRPWDTMVAAWLLDPERNSYKLEFLASAWLGYSGIAFKDVVAKGQVFSEIELAKAVPYAAEDADFAWQLKQVMAPALVELKLHDLFVDLEMPLLALLARMERHGILVDRPALQAYSVELEAKLAKSQQDSWALAGHEFNLNSPKQLQEVLFVERRLSSGKKTKTGFSTDVSVLEELAREDPLPALILQHRSLQKLKSTYVDALLELSEEQPRIHTHFVQSGTATGRLSSREPNLQNIPIRDEDGRRIRAAFVAAPGCKLISADYAQIELVVFAHLAQDEELCRAFRDGADVHRRTASLIFGIKEEDISPVERRAAKTINFGIIYGMGAFRLAGELGIPRKEAQRFIEAYFARYSGVARFIQTCIDQARSSGYVETILGRRRPILAIASRNANERQAAERVAVNTPIQGSAADIMKLAMLKVDEALRRDYPEARFLLQVHDELIIEAPEAQAETIAATFNVLMGEAISLSLPLRASVELADSWGDIH